VLERLKKAGVAPLSGNSSVHHLRRGRRVSGRGDLVGHSRLRDPDLHRPDHALRYISVRNGQVFNKRTQRVGLPLHAVAAHLKTKPEHSLLIAALDARSESQAASLMRDPPVPVSAMIVDVNRTWSCDQQQALRGRCHHIRSQTVHWRS
jgi:hypothetical protein